jgi:hypothetical protein
MSKETASASNCACGQRIQFASYHLPHCPAIQRQLESLGILKAEREKLSKSSKVAYTAVR